MSRQMIDTQEIRRAIFKAARDLCKTEKHAACTYKNLTGAYPKRDWNEEEIEVEKDLYLLCSGMIRNTLSVHGRLFYASKEQSQ